MTLERRTVLVVDDEPSIRALLQNILQLNHFDCLTAATGEEAVIQFAKHQESITLVLMDVNMPDMNGVQAFDAIRAIAPEVRCVFLTGFGGVYSLESLRTRAPVLKKPFNLPELVAVLTDPAPARLASGPGSPRLSCLAPGLL